MFWKKDKKEKEITNEEFEQQLKEFRKTVNEMSKQYDKYYQSDNWASSADTGISKTGYPLTGSSTSANDSWNQYYDIKTATSPEVSEWFKKVVDEVYDQSSSDDDLPVETNPKNILDNHVRSIVSGEEFKSFLSEMFRKRVDSISNNTVTRFRPLYATIKMFSGSPSEFGVYEGSEIQSNEDLSKYACSYNNEGTLIAKLNKVYLRHIDILDDYTLHVCIGFSFSEDDLDG